MIRFINKLLSTSNEVSSKRFIGVISFLFLLAAGIVNLIGGPILSADFIAVFGSIIGATILGNVVESVTANNNETKFKIESGIDEPQPAEEN